MKNAIKYFLFFRNVVFLKWAFQVIFLFGILSIIWNYIQNAIVNLADTNIAFSWGWLGETPGVSVAEGMYTLPNSGLQMIQTGMVNMFRITVTGIFAATVLGTFLGIARLSSNYIVEKSSTGLLEVVRNVPLLVQIYFFQAFVLSFPRLEVFDTGEYFFHASAKGIAFPWFNRGPNSYLLMVYALLVLYIANKIYKWRVEILEREGRDTKPFLWSVGTLITLLVIGWYGGFRAAGVVGFLAGYISMGLEAVPAIVYQMLISGTAIYIGFKATKKFIDSKKSEEAQGIYSDDDYFKIILNVVVVLLVVLIMFSSIGAGFAGFLVGDEITFKADWGLPQLFHGIENKLHWYPSIDVEVVAEIEGMKKAEIINWEIKPGDKIIQGDVIATAYATGTKIDKQEVELIALETGTVESLLVEEKGIAIKLGTPYYELEVTDGDPFIFSKPKIEQVGTTKFQRYAKGHGKSLSVGYFAIWLGVVLYTAIFISEVVRAGIMAVSKGQSEAGMSLGLRRGALLRLVVLPQAIRVMLPPMGNQYLNLAKNTSLGIAVAYPEIVAVGQTLYNQEGQTLPVFLIWMMFYSSVSLTISSIINYYNRKMKIVER
ncbi:MAG: ABC transporter permease subunit [Candidatus Actinomarinales bacterium]|nr:MAG: ABC transporter permease subunit [Candidatus Actinomarinales bacterium]